VEKQLIESKLATVKLNQYGKNTTDHLDRVGFYGFSAGEASTKK